EVGRRGRELLTGHAIRYSPWQGAAAMARALPDGGTPNGVVIPPAPGTAVPVVWHVVALDIEAGGDGLELGTVTSGVNDIRGAAGFGVRATDGGLRPPPPSSVAPSGIPALPTDDPGPIAEDIG